jgi:hypothetical protein
MQRELCRNNRPPLSATRIAFARLRPVPIAHEAFDLVECPGNRLIDTFALLRAIIFAIVTSGYIRVATAVGAGA